MTYISTKTYGDNVGLSCCFRQWRAESHCKYLHGYALKVRLEFEADELDLRNWVVDFGGLKSFKMWLESVFDHKLLIAEDDPMRHILQSLVGCGVADTFIVKATGCEAFAKMIYDSAVMWLDDAGYFPRVRMRSVEVSEHGVNSAIYFNQQVGEK